MKSYLLVSLLVVATLVSVHELRSQDNNESAQLQLQVKEQNNLVPVEEISDTRREGDWVRDGKHTYTNMVCYQNWMCTNKEDWLHSDQSRIVCSGPQGTTGTCMADANDPGCANCTAPKPTEKCECWLEKK